MDEFLLARGTFVRYGKWGIGIRFNGKLIHEYNVAFPM